MNEALVLKKTDFEETSVIINVITENGYESLMLKGAKRKNSLKLALTEPLTKIAYTKGKGENMALLYEGEVVDNYQDIKSDLDRLSIASVVLDYAVSIRGSLVSYDKLYSLIIDTLKSIEIESDPEFYLFRFEIALSSLLGISPRKSYLLDEYKATPSLIESIEAVLKGEEIKDRLELRNFFIEYYFHELDIKLKSKKLYLSIIKEA